VSNEVCRSSLLRLGLRVVVVVAITKIMVAKEGGLQG
jgi:hypothetical protein